MFAIYGVVAMLAYFPGGLIADRFAAKQLLTASLLATAAGGMLLLFIPVTPTLLMMLFAYWGLTTILLFWSAMIKATRDWGGNSQQGLAFGLLDSGRGLTASLAATVGVWLLARSVSDDAVSLNSVIIFYSCLTAAAAVLIWLCLEKSESSKTSEQLSLKKVFELLKSPVIQRQAIIVVCAYCGYKSLDNYGIYLVQVQGLSDVQSASFMANVSYLRPVAALAAGLLADRFLPSKLISLTFLLMVLSFTLLATNISSNSLFITANIIITCFAVFALRGIYFTLLEQTQIKDHSTGTAVGIISVVGFTPDIFFGALTGRLLDANPGLPGFQYYFLITAVIAIFGMAASLTIKTSGAK